MVSETGPINIPPPILQAITNDIGHHPELDGTMLLLKTPQTCVTEYGVYQTGPHWLAFISTG